jgi:hypothetical protein
MIISFVMDGRWRFCRNLYFPSDSGWCHSEGTVIWLPVRRPLPMFQRLQLSDLTCPLRDEIVPNWYDMSRSACTAALHFYQVAPTWQQSCAFFSFVVKFGTLLTLKSLYPPLISPQSSACLHPCTAELWPPTRACSRRRNVHCDACRQLNSPTSDCLYPPCKCSK